ELRGVLARLELPDLPEAQLPEAYARLPDYPVFTADGHPPPRFELPAWESYLNVGRFAPGASIRDGSPRAALERAHDDANARFGAAASDGMRRLADAVRERFVERRKAADDIAPRIAGGP